MSTLLYFVLKPLATDPPPDEPPSMFLFLAVRHCPRPTSEEALQAAKDLEVHHHAVVLYKEESKTLQGATAKILKSINMSTRTRVQLTVGFSPTCTLGDILTFNNLSELKYFNCKVSEYAGAPKYAIQAWLSAAADTSKRDAEAVAASNASGSASSGGTSASAAKRGSAAASTKATGSGHSKKQYRVRQQQLATVRVFLFLD